MEMDGNVVREALLDLGGLVADTAEILANSRDMTLDQAYQAVHTAALMLVNGTLYNGLGGK